jgi:hypothetical protein
VIAGWVVAAIVGVLVAVSWGEVVGVDRGVWAMASVNLAATVW